MLRVKERRLYRDGKPVSDWDRDLSQAEIDALESGYSPLWFKAGLVNYRAALDMGALYGLTPRVEGV